MDIKDKKSILPVIKLDDLLPHDDVKGGKSQGHIVFGAQPPMRSRGEKNSKKLRGS